MQHYLSKRSQVIYPTEELRKHLFVITDQDGNQHPAKFAILFCDKDLSLTADTICRMVMDFGGHANIRSTPDYHSGTINVVIGGRDETWSADKINLYASNLVTEAVESLKFDANSISIWKL